MALYVWRCLLYGFGLFVGKDKCLIDSKIVNYLTVSYL